VDLATPRMINPKSWFALGTISGGLTVAAILSTAHAWDPWPVNAVLAWAGVRIAVYAGIESAHFDRQMKKAMKANQIAKPTPPPGSH
jgi:hypothetical protein